MKFTAKPIVLLFIVALFSSCVENLDFDQVELDVNPIFNSPLVSLELDQNDFFDVDNGVEISSVVDITDLTILDSSIIQDNLTEVTFTFEVENRFDRFFKIQVLFFDDNDNITYDMPAFFINAGDLNYTASRRIFISNPSSFLNSTKLSVAATLIPSSNQLDPDIPKTLSFKSVGTYYLSF
tara:strand:- start:11522 stop:12064 length:543 start_codon:yes stop_codon:yes gene_type:complete